MLEKLSGMTLTYRIRSRFFWRSRFRSLFESGFLVKSWSYPSPVFFIQIDDRIRIWSISSLIRNNKGCTGYPTGRISGLFLYPVSGRISGFVCRISGRADSRISGQKNFTWYILSSKPRSPLNITIKFRKL